MKFSVLYVHLVQLDCSRLYVFFNIVFIYNLLFFSTEVDFVVEYTNLVHISSFFISDKIISGIPLRRKAGQFQGMNSKYATMQIF